MGERHVGSGCGQRGIEIGGKPRDEFVRGSRTGNLISLAVCVTGSSTGT